MINDKLPLKKFNFSKELESKISMLSRGVDKRIFRKMKINRSRLLKNMESTIMKNNFFLW